MPTDENGPSLLKLKGIFKIELIEGEFVGRHKMSQFCKKFNKTL